MSSLNSSPLDYHVLVSEFVKNNLPIIPKILAQKQLSQLKQELGHKNIIKFIYALLVDLTKTFNVGKGMDESQLIETSTNLVDDFYGFRLVDFAICFKKAKKGSYGKVYDRIDMPTIYEWLLKYDQERTSEIVRHNLKYKEGMITSPRSSQTKDLRDDPKFREVMQAHILSQHKKDNNEK